jgi:hypothetical protein
MVEASTWSPTLERMWSDDPSREQTTPSRGNASLPLATDVGAEQCTPTGGPSTSALRMPNASRTCSMVYYRRCAQVVVTAPVETSATEGTSNNPSTLATLAPTSARRRSSFMAKITKKTVRILPTLHATRPKVRFAHLRLLHDEADGLRVLSLNRLLKLQIQGTRRR